MGTGPVEVIPGAKGLITSLRDMGYDFTQAVADVVDNSIDAECSVVRIEVAFDGQDSWVRIADDGRGMSKEELLEALRFGAEGDYGDEDLGKFGLGLKTASMSQCRRLTVASRSRDGGGKVAAYSWDLDHIEATNRWEVLPVATDKLPIREALTAEAGTVVLWEGLDRFVGLRNPGGATGMNRFNRMCRGLEDHLAMVFHRFMERPAGDRALKIFLNGNQLRPWDPFCRAELGTERLREFVISMGRGAGGGDVRFRPFVLPHQHYFSSTEEWKRAGGVGGWQQQQGLYIYRADRMIQSGGWSKLRAVDEHLKLARVAVDFSRALDEAVRINVAKMRVQLPEGIERKAKEDLAPTFRRAEEVYRHSSPRSLAASVSASGTPAVRMDSGGGGSGLAGAIGTRPGAGNLRLTLGKWAAAARAVAQGDERPVLERILSRLLGGDKE